MDRWFQAAQSGNYQFICENKDTYVRKQDCLFKNKTALMYAAKYNHLQIIEELLEAENGIQSDNGWTALHYAVSCGNIEAVKLLYVKEKCCRNQKQQTAFDLALLKNQVDIITLIQKFDLQDSGDGITTVMGTHDMYTISDDDQQIREIITVKKQNQILYDKIQTYEQENRIYKGIIENMTEPKQRQFRSNITMEGIEKDIQQVRQKIYNVTSIFKQVMFELEGM
ncbi:Ankyrin_repeat-containing protein [Hexamita inflata]|uniref:Ankyrin repeat-containing protein n=1 Tax=Hexamita inflata TaxID=28002 RepID=A0AA86NGR1_9EUKA|nr:Ankyrin repeat-containing protein [Hexamita inflata]